MSSPVTVADLDDRLVEIENDGALICVSRAGLHLLAIVHKHDDMGCFCGSNAPFRECCNGKYDYDLNMWNKRILSAVRKTTPDDECCAWPDKGGKTCGQVMNSHSAQSALLQGICDVDKDGRTATGKNYVLSMDAVTRDDFDEGAFGFPIGINRAGTFRRFCQPHDTEAFKSIESGARFKGDTRQFLEVGYRAACFTDYCGRFINAQIQEYIDCLVRQGFPGPLEGRGQVFRGHMRGVDEAVHKYDVMIANGDLRDVDGVSFEIEGEMSFIATGYNRIARSLRSSKGDGLIGFGIVPSAEPGRFCIVFSWFRSDRIARSFAKDLASLKPEFLPMTLLQTIFATTQNIFFSKQWADTLPSGLKDHLKLLNSAERVGYTDKVETNKRLTGFRLTGITYCPIEQKPPIRTPVTPPPSGQSKYQNSRRRRTQ